LAWLAPGRLVESLQALRGPTPTTCCLSTGVRRPPLDNRNYSRVSFEASRVRDGNRPNMSPRHIYPRMSRRAGEPGSTNGPHRRARRFRESTVRGHGCT
jgi:hypothetical protein